MGTSKSRKRRETFGRIDKRGSGRYRARYIDPDGRVTASGAPVLYSAPHTFDTITDARTWLNERQREIQRGEWKTPEALAAENAAKDETLAEYAAMWLVTNRNRKGEPLRPRTVDEYKRMLRAPDPDKPDDKGGPLASLIATRLGDITIPVVDQWYDKISRTGKLTQAARAYSLLSTILKHAVERDRIPANPCRVKGAQTATTGKTVQPPTDAELAEIIENIDAKFRALVWVAAEGGLRWGEATELRRDDILIDRDDDGNVIRALIRVDRAVTRTSTGYVVGRPKSDAGLRAVYVYGAAAEAVAEHLRTHVSRFGNPLLFPAIGDKAGKLHLAQSAFHSPHWRDARKAAGRPDMPFHALRHRAATVYVQHGATTAEALQRMGHTSLKVAQRYQHATGRDAEIAARMAQRSN